MPATFTAINPPLEAWGDHSLDVSFAGLLFRFVGLSARQVQPIAERFDLGFATDREKKVAMCIEVGHQAFANEHPDRYRGLDDNYTPVIEHLSPDCLWIDGVDFRGAITLGDPIAGRLYTAEPDKLVNPVVMENYLRIVTAYAALRCGGLLFHSAGVVVDGSALLFIGRSNAGKTTISRLALAAGYEVLSDDANLLLPGADSMFRAGPIPFAGELGQTACKGREPYPVAGIYWLAKSPQTAVHRFSAAAAYSKLLVCSPTVNADEQQFDRLDEVLRKLLDALPISQLDFSRDDCFDEIITILGRGHS